jgi:transposase-like protein
MYQFGTGFKSTDHGNISRMRKSKSILVYIIDETVIKAGSELIWFWVVIEPADKEILSFQISKERNMFVMAE